MACLAAVVSTVLSGGLAVAAQPAERDGVSPPVIRGQAGDARPDAVAFVPGEVLVRFRSGTSPARRAQVRRAEDARLERKLPLRGVQQLELDRGESVRAAVRDLERRPEVVYAQPNYINETRAIPNDPRFGELWGLQNTGQALNGDPAGTADADIDAPEAWSATQGSENVKVAVVDSGVAYDHPDLAPNIWRNPGETGGGKESNGVDDDSNGHVDDHRGWDFAGNDNDPDDPEGHGTHVAGTIGGRGNDGRGVTGVNWRVSVMALRGGSTDATAAAAIRYAARHGATAVNASFGHAGPAPVINQAVAASPDTLFVAAAGNDGAPVDDAHPESTCSVPSANAICVAASDQHDRLASFSNRGAHVDLAAPGVSILSSYFDHVPLFADDFETDIAGRWTTGGTNNTWGRTDKVAASPIHSLTDSPDADYLDSTNSFASPPAVDLSAQQGCSLGYGMLLAAEEGYDGVLVEASRDGTSWALLAAYTGSGSTLRSEGLEDFDGDSSVFLRYRFLSDESVTDDGVYIDDVTVACRGAFGHEFFAGTSMAAPHVAGVAGLLKSRFPWASVATLRSALLSGGDAKVGLGGAEGTVTGRRLNAHGSLSAACPSLATMNSRLDSSLAATARRMRAARLRGILRAGGFQAVFSAPDRGTLSEHATAPTAGRRIVAASGSRGFTQPASVSTKVSLSSAGRSLLRRSSSVRFGVRASFSGSCRGTVSRSRSVTVAR